MNHQTQPRSFTRNVFEFYSQCLESQRCGRTLAIIAWLLSWFELTVYSFNQIMRTGLFENSAVGAIYNYSQYIYIGQLKSVSQILYTSIAWSIKGLVFLNLLVFFVFVVDRLEFLRSNRFRRIYCALKFWKIFWFIGIFAEVICNDLIEAAVNGPDFVSLTFGILALALFVSGLLQHAFFMQFDYFDKENQLASIDSLFYTKFAIFKLVLFFILFFLLGNFSYTLNIISIVLLTTLAFIAFLYCNFERTLENRLQSKIFSGTCTLYFSLMLSFLIAIFYSGFEILFAFFALSFFTCLILRGSFLRKFNIDQSEKIRTKKEALFYVYYFLRLIQKSDNNSLATLKLKGQLSTHSLNCQNAFCSCQKSEFFVLSKNEFVRATPNEKMSLFTKNLLAEKLFLMCQSNSEEESLKFLLASFYHKKLKNRILAVKAAKIIREEKLSLGERFQLFKLLKDINAEQEEFNRDRLKDKRFEELINFERASKHFSELVAELFVLKWRFWNFMLYNNEVSQVEFNDRTSKILSIQQECEGLLKAMDAFAEYSSKLQFLFGFVRRELLNLKISEKLDELYLNLEEEEEFAFREDMSILNANFYNTFLRNSACVVELDMTIDHPGQVLRASASVEALFGLPKESVIGQSINNLMPSAIAERHEAILNEAAQKGVFKSKSNSLSSWGMRHGCQPFALKVKYKLELTRTAEAALLGLVVQFGGPGKEPEQFVVTDDFGFIDGMSKALRDSLSLPEKLIADKRVNVGMLNSELLRLLPVNNVIGIERQRTSSLSARMNTQISAEKKFCLQAFKDQGILENQAGFFQALKGLTNEMLDELKNEDKRIIFDSQNRAFISKKKIVENSLEDISEEQNAESFVELIDEKVQPKQQNEFQVALRAFEEKKQSLPCAVVFVEMNSTVERQYSIPNFNVFVIKKFEPQQDLLLRESTRRVSTKKPDANQPDHLLSPEKSKELISISQISPLETSPNVESENKSERSDSKFLPYIKQTLNVFHKQKIHVPSKNYPIIGRTEIFVWALVAVCLVCEAVLLFNYKLPEIDSGYSLAFDYSIFSRFERSLVDSYSFLCSNNMPSQSSAIPKVLAARISEAKQLAQDNIVVKYMYMPDFNAKYSNVFSPGLELQMNNAFLTQNFIYELNKYATNQTNFTDFKADKHDLFLYKFKARLLSFFLQVRQAIEQELASWPSNLSSNLLIMQFSVIALVETLCLIFMTLIIIAFIKIGQIKDTILSVEDQTVISILNFYALGQAFYRRHFGNEGDNPLPKTNEKMSTRTMISAREKKRCWGKIDHSRRKRFWLFTILVLLADILFMLVLFGKCFGEIALVNYAGSGQTVSPIVAKDAGSVPQLILHAKESLQRPDSLWVVDPAVISELNQNIEASYSFTQGGSLGDIINEFYGRKMCSLVNSTALPNITDCTKVYDFFLQNNVNSIKSILRDKLGFVFQNKSAVAFNYTFSDSVSLDEAAIYYQNAMEGILGVLEDSLGSHQQTVKVIFLVLGVVFCAAMFYVWAVWSWYFKRMLNENYLKERAIFLNFMPVETLNKNKLVQVKLARDEILKRK